MDGEFLREFPGDKSDGLPNKKLPFKSIEKEELILGLSVGQEGLIMYD